MKFKKTAWLAVVMVAIPLAYFVFISFVPEDLIVVFHWPR
jgi:hypothetical protein